MSDSPFMVYNNTEDRTGCYKIIWVCKNQITRIKFLSSLGNVLMPNSIYIKTLLSDSIKCRNHILAIADTCSGHKYHTFYFRLKLSTIEQP